MADRIKGITIEIDGETTGLKQALSGVTKESISIQKELTDVQRLLKFDPGNTAALAQKQELLSKQVELTSQKLKALKDAQSQVDAQFAKGDIGEAQYRAFQREIEFTEASLNKFKTAYENAMNPPKGDLSEPLKKLNEEAEKSKGVFDNMGEYIKRGVGMAIGGDIWDTAKENFKEVISFGSDWQKSLNTLQAQTGATGEEMDKLSQAMTNVYGNNFGSSMEDVAESMMEVRTYLQGTGEDIQSATQNAIAFRDTFGVEVPESMRSVQALMKQFGLTSEEAFNLLAQGQQQGLNYSDELYDSVNEYSVQFGKLGLNAEDMFNIFSSGAQNGAFNLDKIGDAVKEFSIRAIDGSKTTQQGFEALGLNADEMAQKFAAGGDTAKEAFNQVIAGLRNMNDPVAQSTAGVDLFGTMWEDLGPQVVTSLDSVQGAFDQTKNSMEQINKVKYNDPISALEGMGRQIQTSILLPISNDVLPSLNNMANQLAAAFSSADVQAGIQTLAQGLGDFIKGVADAATNILPKLLEGLGWIMDNADTIAIGIVAIGTAMKAFEVADVIMGVVEAVKAFKLANEGATIAQWALNLAMDANPIGAIIIAIASLVAGLIYFYNSNEDFRNNVNEAWEQVKNKISEVVEEIKEIIAQFVEIVQEIWAQYGDQITKIATDVWNNVSIVIQTAINFIKDWLKVALALMKGDWYGAWEGIKQGFADVWGGIFSLLANTLKLIFDEFDLFTGGLLTSIANFISGVIAWFADLPNKASELWTTITTAFTDGWNNIVNFFTVSIPTWLESMGTWFAELPNKIAFGLGEATGSVMKWGSDTWSYLSTNVPQWIDSIGTWFAQLPDKIWTAFVDVNTKFALWAIDVGTWINTNVSAWITSIVNFFSQLPGQIWNWLTQCVTNITTWGSNMLTEATAGMTSVVDGIVNTFTNLPSKMAEIGSNIVQGLIDGLKEKWDSMTGWLGGLCNKFIAGIEKKFDINSPSRVMKKIGGYIGEGLAIGIGDTVGSISKQANAIADAAMPNINTGTYDMGVNYNPIGGNSSIPTGSNLDALLAKMDSMTQAILSMQILMDSKEVGKLVTPTVSNQLAFNNGRKGWD